MPFLALTFVFVASILAVGCAGVEGHDEGAQSGAAITSDDVLLDCQIDGAERDQEVIVAESFDGTLRLKEITAEGDAISRPLSEKEWDSGTIALQQNPSEPSAVNRLSTDASGKWIYASKGGDDDFEAPAVCTSHPMM